MWQYNPAQIPVIKGKGSLTIGAMGDNAMAISGDIPDYLKRELLAINTKNVEKASQNGSAAAGAPDLVQMFQGTGLNVHISAAGDKAVFMDVRASFM